MSSSFAQAGREMLNTATSHLSNDALFAIRQWLDDAPGHAQDKDIDVWGMLMSRLVRHNASFRNPGDTTQPDAVRFLAYLAAVDNLSEDQWWSSGPVMRYCTESGIELLCETKPVYDAFMMVWNAMGISRTQHAHVFLPHLLLDLSWTPDALVARLHAMYSEQIKYAAFDPLHSPGLLNTAKGSVLHALHDAVFYTSWRPHDDAILADVWNLHDYALGHMPGKSRIALETAFVKNLLSAMPNQLDQALHSMLASKDTHFFHAQALFPLPLSGCRALETLDALIGLVNPREGMNAVSVMQAMRAQLKSHHPDVASMLAVHSTIFPDARVGNTFVEALLPAFEQFLGQQEKEPVECTAYEFDAP